MKPSRRIALPAGILILLTAAGTAYALFGRGHGEVTTSSREAYESYQKGLDAERKLYFKDAVAAYADALSHDPDFVMAAVRLAGQLAGRDPERARSLLACAASRVDGLTEREKLTVEIYRADLEAHDYKRVGALLDEYIRRFPGDPEAYLRRSTVLAKEGKRDEATALLEKVIKLEPNLAYAYNTLGYSWMSRGDFVKAEDYLKRYRFLAPDQANPYDSLGELYANTGRYEEAEENFKKALEIRPDFIASVAHLGVVMVGKGDVAGASGQYLKAAEMAESPKEKAGMGFSAALALASAGKGPEALVLFDRLTARMTPSSPEEKDGVGGELSMLRAIILSLAGRPDDAEAELEKVRLKVEPGKPRSDAEQKDSDKTLSTARGFVALARGDHATAVEQLTKGLRPLKPTAGGFSYYPYASVIRVSLAKELHALSRDADAAGVLHEILDQNPRFQPALDLLGTLPGATTRPAAGAP